MKRSFWTNLWQDRPYAIMPFHVARVACAEYCEGIMEVPLRFSRLLVMSVVLAALASGCTKSKTKTPGDEESVSSTSSAVPLLNPPAEDAGAASPSCGREVQTHGQGYNETGRKCLWDAYQAGRSAELALTRHTIEGDPIIVMLRVRSNTSIEVVEDNRDRFGARGVRSSTCKVLERSPVTNGRSGFVVRGCDGNVETIEVP